MENITNITTSDYITTSQSSLTLPGYITTHAYMIKKVIYQPPKTIVKWLDGTYTMVRCMDGDPYDPELGFLYCVAKKIIGDNDAEKFHREMKKWCWNQDSPQANLKELKKLKEMLP